MPFKTYEINVDLIYTLSSEPVRFSQNDQNSAKLLLNITNKTVDIDLSTATSVRMSFKKPDGKKIFQNDCQPINALKGKYQIVLKTQTLAAVGKVIGQIHIEENGRVIDTQKIAFEVEESLSSDEAIESTNEYGVIQKIIEANEKLEDVDMDALIASEKTANEAKAAAAQNANQIGILSENVGNKAEKSYVDTELAKKATQSDVITKADKTYVDTKVSAIASGSPKGTYATLADLQSAKPTGDSNIYVVTADGKWYYWRGSAWVAGGTYQSTGLAVKSVTPEVTTFIKKSTNLYNKATTTPNKVVTESGVISDSTINSLSDFIPVLPNTINTVRNAHTTVFYTKDKTFISRPGNSAESYSFTTPSNAYWVRLAISNSKVDSAQLNEGGTLLPFEPYYEKIDRGLLPNTTNGEEIDDESIPLKKLDFTQGSSNLYNSQTVTPGKNFNSSTGALIDSPTNTVSDFIPITPSTVYTSPMAHTLAFFNQNKVFISRPYNASGTFTSPINAYFVRLVINSNADVLNAQLNLGNKLLPYEPYYVGIAPSALPYHLREKSVAKEYYFSPEEITKPYKAKQNVYSGFTTPNDYYAAFNSLSSTYSDYLTGTLLGKDQSNTYDIYRFNAKPQQITGAGSLRKKLPKIVLSIGLHGEEKNSIYNIYYLMKDICENWTTDPILEYLRWNVEFVFIPLGNPWCFANGVRHNVNGVDLNRNFPHLWEALTGNEYSGTAPMSEKETQYVVSMIDANKDALYYGDYHTNGSTSTYENFDKLMWVSLNQFGSLYNENVAISARYTIEKMTREYIKDYELPNNVGYFGFISESFVPGGSKTYGASLGIPSSTFETFVKLPTETEKYSQQAVKMGTEFLGNWILNLIKQFKAVY